MRDRRPEVRAGGDDLKIDDDTAKALGEMAEPIRIGVLICNELGGKVWGRKDRGGTPWAFHAGLVAEAGGIRKFLDEWEIKEGW